LSRKEKVRRLIFGRHHHHGIAVFDPGEVVKIIILPKMLAGWNEGIAEKDDQAIRHLLHECGPAAGKLLFTVSRPLCKSQGLH